MKQVAYFKLTLVFLLVVTINSCDHKPKDIKQSTVSKKQNEDLFKLVLTKHLDAVTNRDLTTLKSTMSPKGNMELIQPSSETVYTVDGFIKFHKEWFSIPNWTLKTKILSTTIGDRIGVATTEILYEEPERNGSPYFNRMNVSYTLEKIDSNWYIIKDHASSIEKTKLVL